MPAGLAIVLALGFCGLFTALAVFIGPKATNPEKLKPFECGSEPIGSPRGRYSVKFYQVAILFLVFDIEAAFMYPWAVLYNQLLARCAGVARRRSASSASPRCWCSSRSWSSRWPTSGERRRSDGSRAHHHASRGRRQVGEAVASSRRGSTGRASSRCSRTRSSPRAAAWSSCRVAGPKYDIARFGAEFPRFSPRQSDLLMVVGTITEKQGPALKRVLRADVRAQVGDRLRRVRLDRRLLPELLDDAGRRSGHPGRRLHPRLPAAARAGARRADHAAGPDPGRARPQPAAHQARAADRQRAGRRRQKRVKSCRRRSSTRSTATLRPRDRAHRRRTHGDEIAVDQARAPRRGRDLATRRPAMAFDSPVFVTCDRLPRLATRSARRRAERCGRGQAALRGRLPPALDRRTATACASRSRVPEDDAARARRSPSCGRRSTGRSARPSTCTGSGSTATPTCAASPVRGVRRPPAAQGLPEGEAPAARAARRPADQSDQGASDTLMAATETTSLKQLVLGRKDVAGPRRTTSTSCRRS